MIIDETGNNFLFPFYLFCLLFKKKKQLCQKNLLFKFQYDLQISVTVNVLFKKFLKY